MKKKINALAIILILTAIAVLAFVYSLYAAARQTGDALGGAVGTVVGTAIGAVDGNEKGNADGKEAGLDAKDADVEIANTIQGVGQLEVLETDLKIVGDYQIGKDYAELYSYSGKAVFSVDLNDAVIGVGKAGEVVVLLPAVQSAVFVEGTNKDIIEVYQKSANAGSTEDAVRSKLNSEKEIQVKMEEKISNDVALLTEAEESAKKQVTQLARSLCGSNSITVEFKSGEEKE